MTALDGLMDDELHLAVRVGDLESTIIALEKGFNPNKIGLFEWSSQHEAAHNGDLEILKVLLKYGADCNCKDLLNGSTALHYAASEGHPQCLDLLMLNGADAMIQNEKGQTAPNITRHKGCKEVFAKYGIDITTSVHFEDQTRHNKNHNNCNINNLTNEQKSKRRSTEQKFSSPPSSFSKYTCKSTTSNDSYESGIGSKTSLADSISISSSKSQVFSKGDARSLSSGTPSLSSPCKSYSSFGSLTSIGSSIISGSDDCAGYITMAFQYNSKTSHLKVRIVEIVLTCLLPLNKGRKDVSSMLHVEGLIQKENEIAVEESKSLRMKSKTEIFKLHAGGDQDEPVEDSDGSVQTFWYNKTAHIKLISHGLEFDNVTKDVVKGYSIQISICTRQKKNLLKNTSHSIPLAILELPLKQAVKKLMKETYELQPCYIPGITKNIERIEQVLSEIVIDSGKSRCPSVYSDSIIQGNLNETFEMDEIVDRSASDGDLKQISSIMVQDPKMTSPSSSSYDIQEETESDDNFHLEEVRSHSVPTSPQVKIKLSLNTKNSTIGADTRMDMPIEDKIESTFHKKEHEYIGNRKKSLRRLVISRNQSISTDEEMGSQENIPLEILSKSSMDNTGYKEQKFTSLTFEQSEKMPSRSPKIMRARPSRHVRTQSNDSTENVNENTQTYYKRNKASRSRQ